MSVDNICNCCLNEKSFPDCAKIIEMDNSEGERVIIRCNNYNRRLSLKNIVVVDIDGTLSKVGDRIRHIQQDPKDWDSFYDDSFDDEPIEEVCVLVRRIFQAYAIIFCTGRREKCREKTAEWLEKNVCLFAGKSILLMRKDGDCRSDTVVKPELLREHGINFNDIAFILEDREKMVKAWRELGIRCFKVEEGKY